MNKKPVCLFHFQCPLTDLCENKDCFWKQRDCYGRNPWYDHKNPNKNYEKFGEMKFPTIRGYPGTNEIGLWCEDFIMENWNEGCTYCRDDDTERTEKLKRSIYCWGPKNV